MLVALLLSTMVANTAVFAMEGQEKAISQNMFLNEYVYSGDEVYLELKDIGFISKRI